MMRDLLARGKLGLQQVTNIPYMTWLPPNCIQSEVQSVFTQLAKTWFAARHVSFVDSKTRNIGFQVDLQQCCKTSYTFFVARFTVALATWLDLQRNCTVQVYNHKINTDNCCNHAICWCFTCKLPLGQYWNKMHMLGVSTHAPINWVKLSWRMSRIWKDMKRVSKGSILHTIR